MISANDLFDSAGVSKEDRQACIEFFVLFSRFEYSLKRWGCSDKHSSELKVNWDDAAKKLSSKCDNLVREIRKKDWEIFTSPPKKQVRSGDDFKWIQINTDNMGETRKALCYLCNVRNNLFHGGKWPEEPVIDSARNRKLIGDAIQLVQMFVNSDDTLKAVYSEFA